MRLLERTLARGGVLTLARRGGWRRERFLDAAGVVVEGRIWERHPGFRLGFSGYTVEALSALCFDLDPPGEEPRASGDDLLAFLAAEQDGLSALRLLPWARSPLAWLAFPDRLAHVGRVPSGLEFRACAARSAVLLEGLQDSLADHVVRVEESKSNMDGAELMRVGRAQRDIFHGFLTALDDLGRRDLARFVPRAAQRLAETRPGAGRWGAGLSSGLPLAVQAEARRQSAAFLECLTILETWAREHGEVRFFDDSFDQVQLLLADWALLDADARNHLRGVYRTLTARSAAE